MKYTYQINEMTCTGCQKKVINSLIVFDAEVIVTLQPPRAIIESKKEFSLEEIQKSLSKNGPYTAQKVIIQSNGIEQLSKIATDSVSNAYQNEQISDKMKQLSGKYYCPMLCEGEKVHDKNIGCSICGMDLVKIGGNSASESKKIYLLFIKMLCITIPIFLMAMLGMKTNFFIYQFITPETSLIIQFIGTTFILYLGKSYLKKAYVSYKTLHLNMFSLIGLGAITAYLFSIVVLFLPNVLKIQENTNVYFESVSVIFTLMVFGQWLEAKTHQKTRSSVEHLMDLLPKTVHLIQNGKVKKLSIDHIESGNNLLVKTGEKIPADGKVLSHQATVNEAFLNGEPMPIEKKQQDFVCAGSINTGQSFEMVVTQKGTNTTLSKIVEMVNKASLSQAPIQRLADQVSQYFVPVVITISCLTFLAWTFIANNYLLGLQNAVSVLVIACPCALGLATPISIAMGIGKAAENGILIKKAAVLEIFKKTNVLVTDKTGTLTKGKPSIKEIVSCGNLTNNELIYFATSVNIKSEHPLAKAFINKSKELNIPYQIIKLAVNIAGKGVQGIVDKKKVILGNLSLVKEYKIKISDKIIQQVNNFQLKGNIVSYLIINQQLEGYFVLEDALKKDVHQVINYLKNQKIKISMLTGDSENTAQVIGQEVGISTIYANQSPSDKLESIKNIQNNKQIVTMIGDGINDSPALAQANISLAMGNGADISQDFSDVTIINNQLLSVKKLYHISTKVVKNIKQNLFFAFIYNIVGIFIATGILYPYLNLKLSPMIAALAMCLSSVSVLLNALRLKKMKFTLD